MKFKVFLALCLFIIPFGFAMNLPSEMSMSEICSQLQELKVLENSTIDIENFNATNIVEQISLQNILDEISDKQLAEANLTREQLENMTIDDLQQMGYGIETRDFDLMQNNPIFAMIEAINKTTTIDVYYNKTNCITITAGMVQGKLKTLTFGNYSNPPLYLKVDLIFVEEIIKLISLSQQREGLSAILLYIQVGQKAIGAMFNGNLVISPIWGVFDIFRAFQKFMEAG